LSETSKDERSAEYKLIDVSLRTAHITEMLFDGEIIYVSEESLHWRTERECCTLIVNEAALPIKVYRI
jgi:hypothetical protein